MSDEDVEAIAERVAQLLGGSPSRGGHIDAGEVARRYGVSRGWVYEHARELEAITLGDGPRARLRFDPQRLAEILAATSTPTPKSEANPPRRKPRPRGEDAGLLPIAHRAGLAMRAFGSQSLRLRR
jgi:hypothetical protein